MHHQEPIHRLKQSLDSHSTIGIRTLLICSIQTLAFLIIFLFTTPLHAASASESPTTPAPANQQYHNNPLDNLERIWSLQHSESVNPFVPILADKTVINKNTIANSSPKPLFKFSTNHTPNPPPRYIPVDPDKQQQPAQGAPTVAPNPNADPDDSVRRLATALIGRFDPLLGNIDDDSIDPFHTFLWSNNQGISLKPTRAKPTAPANTSQIPPVVDAAQNESLLTSPANYSDVHPLLIYSMRYEIRSYDLYNLHLRLQSKTPPPNARQEISNLFPLRASNTVSSSSSEQSQANNKVSRTLITGLTNTIGLDFYYSKSGSYLFWTDVIEERIYRGKINNETITDVEVILQAGLATAEGLAIDWIGQNIYWVESTLDHIEVAKMNGTCRRTLIAGDMESPRAIAVDPRYGLLFWSDWDKKNPRIERATMSGEDRRVLVNIKEVNGGWPNGLTLDYDNLKIYWIDANSDSIHVIDYDGNNYQPVLRNFKSLGHPFSITLFDNHLYWTDWKTNSISMANKHNGSDARELQRLMNRLFDIKVVHPSRQPRIDESLNPCAIDNGYCSHLCLLSVNYTRRCECPRLMKLSSDQLACETDDKMMLIGRNNEIRVVDINRPFYHIITPISVPRVFSPKQFEFDTKSKSIFWTDSQTNEVKRAQLVGNSIDTIIEIVDAPSGLALDWISGTIFVTSAPTQKSSGRIFISNLNGEYISILMDGSSHGIRSPKSIAVHPMLGLMYFTDESPSGSPLIYVSRMDGSDKQILITKLNDTRFDNPTSLAIDYELSRLYWVSQTKDDDWIQYYSMTDGRIYSLSGFGGQGPERIKPTALCVDGDSLFVTGRWLNEGYYSEAIYRMNKDGSTRTIVQNLDQLLTVRVYNASAHSGTNECSINNGNCSQLCIPTGPMQRTCKCTMGYSVSATNETHCVGKDSFLIFSYNLGMEGISLEPNSSKDDSYLPSLHKAFRASSIDYVYDEDLIYWVDNEEGSITRIKRDTTNYQVIVQGLESGESIAIDWVAGNIYWLDPYYDIIEVARLDGSKRHVIVSGDMDKPNGIVVNPIKGYLVWSDIGTKRIETAMLDGSKRRTIASKMSFVDDLTIDIADEYIYWLDTGLSLVERVKHDGTGREVVINNAQNHITQSFLVSIAIYQKYLYIADSVHNQGSIIRVEKNYPRRSQVVEQHLGDGMRDITVFAKQHKPSPDINPCVSNNGGCQDLCLYLGEKGKRKCLCSHGELAENGQTCEPFDTFVLFSRMSSIDFLHVRDDEVFNSPYPPISTGNKSSIVALTLDYDAKRVIYSDIVREQICSILFNGTDKRVLVEKQSLVEGLAFAGNQLYWTSMQNNSISKLQTNSLGDRKKVCDEAGCRDSSVEKIILLSSEDKPRNIAVDVCTMYVYWANWNTQASIQRASPRTNYKVESIITTNIKVPNGITIDHKLRKLYWCDAKLDKIETCDMDGSNRAILIAALPEHPFAISVSDEYIFWTDWLARAVFKADKFTGGHPVPIKRVSQRPMGIVVAAPNDLKCPVDLCKFNNGNCPDGTICVTISDSDGHLIECRSKIHELKVPKLGCSTRNKDGSCVNATYFDVINDRLERYNFTDYFNFTDLAPINTWSEQTSTEHPQIATTTLSTRDVSVTLPSSTTTAVSVRKFDVDGSSKEDPARLNIRKKSQTIHDQPKRISDHVDTNVNPLTTTTSAPVSISYMSQTAPITTATRGNLSRAVDASQTEDKSNQKSETTTSYAPPSSVTIMHTTTTQKPYEITPIASNAASSSASFAADCKSPHQFKCYLSEKLTCIPSDKSCDGINDCPSKEDENGCHLSKDRQYNPKRDSNWYRYVTVMMVILGAAVTALFLVFGRSKRRWIWTVNGGGTFNHRRMFDDNGTNIEISNPMFEEDDQGNLEHCPFSIDLNERTTNFSNPLYHQVLLMNEKSVTSH